MKFSNIVVIFLVACCALKEVSSFCPAEAELGPYCYCEGLYFTCDAKYDMKPWDIVGFFDKVSTLIPEDTVYDRFRLQSTTLKEIPAGAFKKIKFRNITMDFNNNLEYIHPDAFGATLETTTILSVDNNEILSNEGLSNPAYNLFNVLNKFKNLEYLYIYDNPIQSLPDNAFVSLPNLVELLLAVSGEKGIGKKIGSKPFVGLPKLQYLRLVFSDISLDDIAEDAFEGIGKDSHVSLESMKFNRLPEKIFKPLLDNARKVEISPYEENQIECNEESDWICKGMAEYRNRIEGFACPKGSEFNNIIEYCDKVNNKN